MERRIFACDVCATEQAQTNHWFAIVIESHKLTMVPLAEVGRIEKAGVTVLHLCGEACVVRKVNEFLGGFK